MDGEHLYALDFDGVLCDSCSEASIAGLEAAKQRWPQVFESLDRETEGWILEKMRAVRPVVETGDDFLLLARLLLELKLSRADQLTGMSDISEENILECWENLKPSLMEGIGETNKVELENLLGDVRDSWISRDLHGWLKANRIYPGIADAMKLSSSKIYIVTTKETRFVAMTLKELGGVDFPLEQICGLGSGPKVEVLKRLQTSHPGMTLHFVEDRLSTLLNVMKKPELDTWNLYLGEQSHSTFPVRIKHIYAFCMASPNQLTGDTTLPRSRKRGEDSGESSSWIWQASAQSSNEKLVQGSWGSSDDCLY